MSTEKAKYGVGQIIHHKIFDYRGVIFDVDPAFAQSDQWYDLMTQSKPAKDQPWYHVLVDESDYITYVAEQNLELDISGTPIQHPDLNKYFSDIDAGIYHPKRLAN